MPMHVFSLVYYLQRKEWYNKQDPICQNSFYKQWVNHETNFFNNLTIYDKEARITVRYSKSFFLSVT